LKAKEGKMSRLLSGLRIFFRSSEALGNMREFDNSEGFDNLVELEEFLPQEFHYLL
jgi:hypothetical protein